MENGATIYNNISELSWLLIQNFSSLCWSTQHLLWSIHYVCICCHHTQVSAFNSSICHATLLRQLWNAQHYDRYGHKLCGSVASHELRKTFVETSIQFQHVGGRMQHPNTDTCAC